VLCDLDRLHARAETHGGVGLCQTADHTTRDTGDEVVRAERLRVELGFGCDEEEDGALRGGFDPGPGDESLVDCRFMSGSVLGYVLKHVRLQLWGAKCSTYIRGHHREPRCGQ
jgi:hypothetical protein